MQNSGPISETAVFKSRGIDVPFAHALLSLGRGGVRVPQSRGLITAQKEQE